MLAYHAHDVAVLESEEIPYLECSHYTCNKCENDGIVKLILETFALTSCVETTQSLKSVLTEVHPLSCFTFFQLITEIHKFEITASDDTDLIKLRQLQAPIHRLNVPL